MKSATWLAVVLLLCAGFSQAQQALVGKYTGSRTADKAGGVGFELDIKSAENGKIQGTVTLNQKRCGGTFPVEGTYQDDKIQLQAAAGGKTGDCGERTIELVASGSKLTGRMLGETGQWRELQLSK